MTHDTVLSFGSDHYQLTDQELVDLERWGLVVELDGQPYPPAPAPDPAPAQVAANPNAGDGEEEITP